MKTGTRLEIIWIDAQTDNDSWEEFEEYEFSAPPLIHTLGFLVHEDKVQYVLAQSLGETVFKENKGDMDSMMQIPKVSIKKVIRI